MHRASPSHLLGSQGASLAIAGTHGIPVGSPQSTPRDLRVIPRHSWGTLEILTAYGDARGIPGEPRASLGIHGASAEISIAFPENLAAYPGMAKGYPGDTQMGSSGDAQVADKHH